MTLSPLIWRMVQWQPFFTVAFEPYVYKRLLVAFSCREGSRSHTVMLLICTVVTQGIKSLGYEPFLIM